MSSSGPCRGPSRLSERKRSARAGARSLGHQSFEGLGLPDREIGQHFAVDLDAGALEAVDKSAVGQPVLAHRGVDALDPQPAEGALLALAVAIGILHGLLDRLLGD